MVKSICAAMGTIYKMLVTAFRSHIHIRPPQTTVPACVHLLPPSHPSCTRARDDGADRGNTHVPALLRQACPACLATEAAALPFLPRCAHVHHAPHGSKPQPKYGQRIAKSPSSTGTRGVGVCGSTGHPAPPVPPKVTPPPETTQNSFANLSPPQCRSSPRHLHTPEEQQYSVYQDAARPTSTHITSGARARRKGLANPPFR